MFTKAFQRFVALVMVLLPAVISSEPSAGPMQTSKSFLFSLIPMQHYLLLRSVEACQRYCSSPPICGERIASAISATRVCKRRILHHAERTLTGMVLSAEKGVIHAEESRRHYRFV